jgi:hypothetical protein
VPGHCLDGEGKILLILLKNAPDEGKFKQEKWNSAGQEE